MRYATIHYLDASERKAALKEEAMDGGLRLRLAEEPDYEAVDYIDFDPDGATAEVGDEGYYLIAASSHVIAEFGICRFHDRADTEHISGELKCPVYGAKLQSGSFLGVITGMPVSARQVVRVKSGRYQMFPRFLLAGEVPYEAPAVDLFYLSDADADYSGMARAYRRFQLTHRGFRTIRDRMNPSLRYAAESLYVRVRLGWKPVSSPVAEQTPENEPPMHTACTFAEVERLMEAYRAAGIERAEFCLVGWNIRGHDGRWPQAFPVEPALGGEEGLRSLIARAKSLGYLISCHTNSTDAYSIADCFDTEDMIRDRDQSVSTLPDRFMWSGGRTYNLCPQRALAQAKSVLPEVAKLGFSGLHYIDVISAVPPRICYHPAHPVNAGESIALMDELFELTQKLFGGSASEGGFDYDLRHCDYCLYALTPTPNGLIDQAVPFWQLTYHGIVLQNPYNTTINAVISKDPALLLKTIEYGGRPAIYYYSKFVSEGKNFLSSDADFTCDTPERLARGVSAAKKQYEIYKELSYLQFCFMEDHRELSPKVFQTTYSDGSQIITDYNTMTYQLIKGSSH